MKLNSIILIVVVILILGTIFFVFQSRPAAKQSNQPVASSSSQDPNIKIVGTQIIEMKPDSFVPDKITIKKNTRVTFKNEDTIARWPASNIHPTHLIYPEFDPKRPVQPGDEWSFIFDKAGIWMMHDHLTPSITGTITVEE